MCRYCAAARANLSDAYKALLAPLLRAELWARKGNTPALVMLMKVCCGPALQLCACM